MQKEDELEMGKKRGNVCKLLRRGLEKSIAFIMAFIMIMGIIPGNIIADAEETYYEYIEVDMPDAILGGTVELPTTCTYYDINGNKILNASVEFSVISYEDEYDDYEDIENPLKIEDGNLTVSKDYRLCKATILAKCNEYEQEVRLYVDEKDAYTYNIYYCDPYTETEPDDLHIILCNKDEYDSGNEPSSYKVNDFDEKEYDSENDLTLISLELIQLIM